MILGFRQDKLGSLLLPGMGGVSAALAGFVIASRLRRGNPERHGLRVPPWTAASLRSSQ